MELIERIPIERINALTTLTMSQFKELTSKCKNETERKQYFLQFKDFIKFLKKSKGEIKRLYSYTEHTPNDVGGRLFSGGSIQGVSADIRGFLCRDLTTDIDMKNAHPSILEYICKLHNIHCPNLSYYNQNRNAILSNFANGKELFLKSVNSDKRNLKIIHPLFVNFDKEMKEIHSHILRLTDYDYITKTVPITKLFNWTGSAINRILCVYENKILQLMINKINQKGYEIFSLMFDGLMIYGNHYENQELLKELEEEIKEYSIRLSYKEHSNTLQLEDLTIEEDDKLTDIEATKLLLKDYPHFVYCKHNLYCFDEDTGLWSYDKNLHIKIITKYAKGFYGTTLSFMETIRKLIPSLCINENWLFINQNSSLKKLLFKNGYYDSITKIFHTDFNPSVVFFHKINYDYTTDIDMTYINSIKNRCFINPLNEECGNYLIENIARGLMGDRMKRIIFGLGESGSGKSQLTDMIKQVGDEFIGNFNGEQLCINHSSADEASKMRWVLLLATKRIIFSNEIKIDANINGQMIKKLSSGADQIEGRTHGGEEQSFYTHFLPIVFANDIPKITPYDDAVDNRLRVVSYNKSFVENPTNEYELQADDNIKEEIKTEKFKQHMMWLFIHTYHNLTNSEPDDVKNSKKEWITEIPSTVGSLLNDYEITNKEDDFIVSTDLQEWVKDKGITITKLGRDINKYAEINKMTNVGSKKKKIAGKSVNIWCGIKSI